MVIGPKEAERLTPEQKEEFEDLESAIDSHLLENYTGDTIEYGLEKLPNVKVQSKLQFKYVKAGWEDVEFEEDKENGGYRILLKP